MFDIAMMVLVFIKKITLKHRCTSTRGNALFNAATRRSSRRHPGKCLFVCAEVLPSVLPATGVTDALAVYLLDKPDSHN